MAQAILPDGWPRPKGYANAVLAQGRQLHIAGMIGWDKEQLFHSDEFHAQAWQALKNIAELLKAAGAKPQHIVRMTWYVTDKKEYIASLERTGLAFRELIGHYDIAMTAVEVQALIEDRAKVEIEVTAVIPE